MLNKEVQYIDISHTPELLRLAEEVQRSKEPRVLTRDGEELAIVSPAKPAGKRPAAAGLLPKPALRAKRAGAPFTLESAFQSIPPLHQTLSDEELSQLAKEDKAERTWRALQTP